MFQLEKFRGASTRHACPGCGKPKEFSRFHDPETGEYLPDHVGICNRSSKCGYQYTAKQFFADNPTSGEFKKTQNRKPTNYGFAAQQKQTEATDCIPLESFKATLGNYNENAFVQFLLDLFSDCAAEIQNVLKMYFVGTFEDYTCFPSIDRKNRVCRAKLIRFNPETGKRLKGDFDTSSLLAKLKLKDFKYKQLFFGEHLLSRFPNKPVAIVEAEKSAIIGALCFPEFAWLGSNNKSWLNAARLQQVGDRRIILYPDADGFEQWRQIAQDASRRGLTVKVSSLIENHATDEQKAKGYDLADYLINEQKEINEFNAYADRYNAVVDDVLRDESALIGFETILEEQKSVMVIDGGMSEADAESYVRQPENLRRAAMCFMQN